MKHCESNEYIDLNSHKGISFSFIMRYIYSFFLKYKWNEFVLIMIVVIALLLMNLSIMIIQNHTAYSIDEYQSLSNNQMFIVKDKNKSYVDQDLEAFHFDNQQEGSYQVYPYLRTSFLIGGMIVLVVPIYNKDAMEKNKVLNYGDESIYLSQSLHQRLISSSINFRNVSTTLTIQYSQNHQSHINEHQMNLSIGGTVDNNVPCYYLKDKEFCVYMDYDILKKIYADYQLDNIEQYIGYTRICNNFDTYLNMYQNMQDKHIETRLFFLILMKCKNLRIQIQ